MRVAISTLSGAGYGGVTYFRNFLPALAEVDAKNEYIIFARREMIDGLGIAQANFRFVECSECMRHPLLRLLWEQLILPIKMVRMRVDVLFTAKNMNLFLATTKSVIAIRNMEPFFYRRYRNHWRLNFSSLMRSVLTRLSMRKASAIIAVSRSTKDYLSERFPHHRSKLSVVYNGRPEHVGVDISGKCEGDDREFILTSSKYVAYANQISLLEGYAELLRRGHDAPPLWMAGGVHDPSYYNKLLQVIKDEGVGRHVKILGLLSHAELGVLYGKACCFVFPSTVEACPQTLIEAMGSGVPIAASNAQPMPDICGAAAIYFEPYDKHDIADRLHELLTNAAIRARLKRASVDRSKQFCWRKTASETVRVLEQVV